MPTSAELANSLVSAAGSGDAADAALVVARLAVFPVAVLTRLQQNRTRVRACRNSITDHLVSLRLGLDEEKHPVAIPAAVSVACDGCLLAATSGRALIHLDGADSDEQIRQLISWTTPSEAKPTYYANAGPALLDVLPANPERMPLPGPYDRERWLTFTHERIADPFVRTKFAATQPAAAQPSDYRPRWLDPNPPPAAEDCGAPIDRLPASVGEPALPISRND